MDNINNLTEWILTQSESEAGEILAQAEEKRRAVLEDADARLEGQFAERSAMLRRLSEEQLRLSEDRERSLIQKERIRFKQSLTEACFSQAEEALCGLSGDEFLAFFQRAADSLPLEGEYTVRLGERTLRSLSDEDKARLAVRTGGYALTVSEETVPSEGGFVLERFPVEYSFLYSDLLADVKAREGARLMKLLLDGSRS